MSVIRHVMFHGRVQGVGYRAFVADEAERARPRTAGSATAATARVEAVFSGEAADVDTVIEACRKGPLSARVDRIDQREATAGELALRGPQSFAVLPTVL